MSIYIYVDSVEDMSNITAALRRGNVCGRENSCGQCRLQHMLFRSLLSNSVCCLRATTLTFLVVVLFHVLSCFLLIVFASSLNLNHYLSARSVSCDQDGSPATPSAVGVSHPARR